MIKSSSATVYMAKLDVESAFRVLLIAPTDRRLLGFRWRGLFLYGCGIAHGML